jgi:hypothetical protein
VIIVASIEQRITNMLAGLEALTPAEHKASIALAEAKLALQQVTVEQARLKAAATATRTKDDAARYVEYSESTVKPAVSDVLQAYRDLMKVKGQTDFDNASEALSELFADITDGAADLREEISTLFGQVKDRATARTRVARSGLAARLGSLAASVAPGTPDGVKAGSSK